MNAGQEIEQLTHELAYEYWHRMLFARFLAENHLLMHPDGVAVSLDECEELAAGEGAANGYVLAARYASRMLPQIFRTDNVLLEIEFPADQRLPLEKLLGQLPPQTFTADDSLGWVYQFWQRDKKDEVNRRGDKIDGRSLPAVTQLFTEHYMVLFLLHNTIGAWWAGRKIASGAQLGATEEEARRAVAVPGVTWEYLRFVRSWDQTRLVYARIAGAMSPLASELLEREFSRLVPSLLRSVTALQERQLSNEPLTQLSWFDARVLIDEIDFARQCLDAYFSSPAGADSIERRFGNAVKLLVSADEQSDHAIGLALAFSAVEAMLCEGNSNISEQLAVKATTLLAPDGETRLRSEQVIKKLYDTRSRAMHGDQLSVDKESLDQVRRMAAGIMKAVVERQAFVKRLDYAQEKPKELFEALKVAHRMNRPVDGVPDDSFKWLPTVRGTAS